MCAAEGVEEGVVELVEKDAIVDFVEYASEG